MNRLTIIGNVVRDAEVRNTQTGIVVATFTVAVNKRGSKEKKENGNDTDFFRVSAWRKLGENVGRYVKKGMKVAVVGAVSLHMYTNDKGETKASLEVNADDVEFLTRVEGNASDDTPQYEPQAEPKEEPENDIPEGFTGVETDELPFK